MSACFAESSRQSFFQAASDSQALLRCLREVPLNALVSVPVKGLEFAPAFGPSIDGVVIDPGDPDDQDFTLQVDTINTLNNILVRKDVVAKLSRYFSYYRIHREFRVIPRNRGCVRGNNGRVASGIETKQGSRYVAKRSVLTNRGNLQEKVASPSYSPRKLCPTSTVRLSVLSTLFHPRSSSLTLQRSDRYSGRFLLLLSSVKTNMPAHSEHYGPINFYQIDLRLSYFYCLFRCPRGNSLSILFETERIRIAFVQTVINRASFRPRRVHFSRSCELFEIHYPTPFTPCTLRAYRSFSACPFFLPLVNLLAFPTRAHPPRF